MSWTVVVPVLIDAIGDLIGRRRKKKQQQTTAPSFDNGAFLANQAEINRLMAETNQQKINFNELMKKYSETERELEKMRQVLEDQKITSFDQLNASQRRQFEATVEISRSLPPAPLPPNTIGLIGPCGVGKSYLINSISGRAGLCDVGRNQTTMRITPHIVNNVAYVDIPGTTQVLSYLCAEYIGVFKALTFIAVVVDRSIDQISDIALLLERLNIPFVIIFNKCDDGMNRGIEHFKRTAKEEIRRHQFQSIHIDRDVYFVSALNIATPGTDWEALINRITDRVGPINYIPRSAAASTSAAASM